MYILLLDQTRFSSDYLKFIYIFQNEIYLSLTRSEYYKRTKVHIIKYSRDVLARQAFVNTGLLRIA